MANETIADVCAEMKSQNECYACRTFADRILAAHNREMAAKDEMARITAQSAQARFDEEMAAKDAEIARLKAALKPVLDHDTSQYGHGRAQPSIVVAVRECQRLMREGGVE